MCRNDKAGIGENKFAQKISQLIKARCDHGCGMLINLVEHTIGWLPMTLSPHSLMWSKVEPTTMEADIDIFLCPILNN